MAPDAISPTNHAEAAAALAGAAASRRPVRIIGAGTKLHWGAPSAADALRVYSTALDRTLEHNVGDMTASFESGVPLARAQAELAAHGQMLAIDPPVLAQDESDDHLGAAGPTVGGVFATADAGPLRHRYGQPRDLILGVTVALSDGTVARAGGRVIKNVAGYDLGKLFTGSFGTLGMILALSVRLHPKPPLTATVVGHTDDPGALAVAARKLAQAPLELDALDVRWRGGAGALLARTAGAQAHGRAAEIAAAMRSAELLDIELSEDDEHHWIRQRAGQRSDARAIARVNARPTALPAVLAVTDARGGSLVGRAAFGTSFIELEPERVEALRAGLPDGATAVMLDLPASHRGAIDPWPSADGSALALMHRVKQRFDPAAICNPGIFVGGI
jgi:glycolate oxidase FAD binding subunit